MSHRENIWFQFTVLVSMSGTSLQFEGEIGNE